MNEACNKRGNGMDVAFVGFYSLWDFFRCGGVMNCLICSFPLEDYEELFECCYICLDDDMIDDILEEELKWIKNRNKELDLSIAKTIAEAKRRSKIR